MPENKMIAIGVVLSVVVIASIIILYYVFKSGDGDGDVGNNSFGSLNIKSEFDWNRGCPEGWGNTIKDAAYGANTERCATEAPPDVVLPKKFGGDGIRTREDYCLSNKGKVKKGKFTYIDKENGVTTNDPVWWCYGP